MNNVRPPLIPCQKLRQVYRRGYTAPLVYKLPPPCDPWEAFQKLQVSPYAFILDSVKPKRKTAAYSYIGCSPFLVLKKRGTQITLETGNKQSTMQGSLITVLRRLFHRYRGLSWQGLPDFTGGAVGYFGYDLAWDFEKLPRQTCDDLKLDDVVLLFIQNLLAFDLIHNELYLIANLIPALSSSFDSAFTAAADWISRIRKKIVQPAVLSNGNLAARHFRPDVSKRAFKKMVHCAKQYIEAGDIYQANLSQRFSFRFDGRPETLYHRLRVINPSPFASFLKLDRLSVVSSSPERLVRKKGRQCETRPIAGTRPRGRHGRENQWLRRDLLSNAKERAEHIMLVDLERNDLGRICEPKTIRVNEMMTTEAYSHVVHLVSNIRGRMQRGKDQFDLLKAMFPGGTITGCPKIRCMEIIESLEQFKRGIYTGSIGFLDFSGDMDLNIVIRTIVLNEGRGYFQVGAGIVYDSDPESEYWETLYKGQALMDTLAGAHL